MYDRLCNIHCFNSRSRIPIGKRRHYFPGIDENLYIRTGKYRAALRIPDDRVLEPYLAR